MSLLAIHSIDGKAVEPVERDHEVISRQLAAIGVRFERWSANQPLSATANQEEVLAAYRDDVARLTAEYGFQSVDVVSLTPDHPQREVMRQKFLAEHRHADFEVRFFVAGKGLFYLHVDDKIYHVLCEAGDLISVPANTPHWFDMGCAPDFKCIRFFVIPDGWVATFTGSELHHQFSDFDQFTAQVAA
jgi:1,2-dihydroxy-3-keto-5-methylthiopentene dioxygenase